MEPDWHDPEMVRQASVAATANERIDKRPFMVLRKKEDSGN
jgi:hypothetical protein